MTATEHPGDNRPSAYWELDGEIVGIDLSPDATMVVRASALGKCLWELAAMLQGHKPESPPPVIQRAFDAGHVIEPYVLERIYGPDLKWVRDDDAAQVQGELVAGGGRVVRFHPDDVATSHRDGIRRIIEVKALSSDNFERARTHGLHSLNYGYDWQLSAQMYALRLPAVYIFLEKPDGFDPENFDPDDIRKANIAMQYVDAAPRSLGEIVRRVKEIHDVATGEDLSTSGRPCDNPKQWPCAFRHLRPEPEGDELPDVPDSQADEFKLLVTRYMGAARLEKNYAEQKAQARAALLDLASEAGLDRGMRSQHYRVRISTSTRRKFDRAAATADGIDLSAYETESTSTTVKVEDV